MQSLATGGAPCCKWAREWRFMPTLAWKWFIYSCLAVQIINPRSVSRERHLWSQHHCSDRRAHTQTRGLHTPLPLPPSVGVTTIGVFLMLLRKGQGGGFRSVSFTCCIIWGKKHTGCAFGVWGLSVTRAACAPHISCVRSCLEVY